MKKLLLAVMFFVMLVLAPTVPAQDEKAFSVPKGGTFYGEWLKNCNPDRFSQAVFTSKYYTPEAMRKIPANEVLFAYDPQECQSTAPMEVTQATTAILNADKLYALAQRATAEKKVAEEQLGRLTDEQNTEKTAPVPANTDNSSAQLLTKETARANRNASVAEGFIALLAFALICTAAALSIGRRQYVSLRKKNTDLLKELRNIPNQYVMVLRQRIIVEGGRQHLFVFRGTETAGTELASAYQCPLCNENHLLVSLDPNKEQKGIEKMRTHVRKHLAPTSVSSPMEFPSERVGHQAVTA